MYRERQRDPFVKTWLSPTYYVSYMLLPRVLYVI